MARLLSIMIVMTAAAIGVVNGAPAQPAAVKYTTPAQVVAAFEKANDANDDAAGLDCMTPNGQSKCLKFMIAMEMATRQAEPGAPAPTAEEKAAHAKMDALLAKHGIKDTAKHPGEEDEAYVNRITAPVTDQRGLLLEMMKLVNDGAKRVPCRKGELKDLKTTGDTATAKYTVKDPDGSSSSQDANFKKIDGSWLIDDMLMLSSSDTSAPGDATTPPPAKP